MSTDRGALPWKDMLDYVASIGAARTLDQFLPRALTELLPLIPYDVAAGFFKVNGPLLCQVGQDEPVRRAYADYYQYRLPWATSSFRRLPASMGGVRRIDFQRDFPDTEFVVDFLPMSGAREMLSARFLCDTMVINVTRSEFAPGFTELETRMLAELTPHIRNMYSVFHKLSRQPEATPSAARIRDSFSGLSCRESEVAALLCRGLTSSEIATSMFISRRTVDAHLAHLYDKLAVHTRAQARRRLLGG